MSKQAHTLHHAGVHHRDVAAVEHVIHNEPLLVYLEGSKVEATGSSYRFVVGNWDLAARHTHCDGTHDVAVDYVVDSHQLLGTSVGSLPDLTEGRDCKDHESHSASPYANPESRTQRHRLAHDPGKNGTSRHDAESHG